MLVQERLQEERWHQDPRTAEAGWQKQPSKTDAYHNYFHEAHKHNPEMAQIADDFWRGHGKPEKMTDVHTLRFNKHLVEIGAGGEAFKVHKKVPHHQQDAAIEHLTRPFAPRRDLQFVPAHMFRIPENMKPHKPEDFEALANAMSRMHYSPEEIQFRLNDEFEDMKRRLSGGPPGTF